MTTGNEQQLTRMRPITMPHDEEARMALIEDIAAEGEILYSGALKRLGEWPCDDPACSHGDSP